MLTLAFPSQAGRPRIVGPLWPGLCPLCHLATGVLQQKGAPRPAACQSIQGQGPLSSGRGEQDVLYSAAGRCCLRACLQSDNVDQASEWLRIQARCTQRMWHTGTTLPGPILGSPSNAVASICKQPSSSEQRTHHLEVGKRSAAEGNEGKQPQWHTLTWLKAASFTPVCLASPDLVPKACP